MNQQQFMKIMSDLQEIASNQKGQILTAQITEKLGKDFTKEQLEAVYAYLTAQHCEIIEAQELPKPENKKKENRKQPSKSERLKARSARQKMSALKDVSRLNVTETTIYRSYMQELSAIEPCAPLETGRLIEALKSGDDAAKNRLIEGHLHLVAEWVKDYAGKGLAITDLIQEGNMALMLYVTEEISAAEFEAGLYQTVTQTVEAALKDVGVHIQVQETMTIRANRLMQVSAELAEEYGREPSLTELAEKLYLSEEEVKEIMKMSMNAMTIEQSKFVQET